MTILNPTINNLIKASNELKKGGIIAFPTETVYGLGALANNSNAIAKIFSIKNRPSFNPIIAHFYSIKSVFEHAKVNKNAEILAQKFWPGPLTMILDKTKSSKISLLASAGKKSIGVRVPANKIAQKILRYCEYPVVAPSANISGEISPSCALHVHKYFDNSIRYIIDGGDCECGIESTVIDCRTQDLKILRHGPITQEMIEKFVNVEVDKYSNTSKNDIISPGMIENHYSPKTPLRINALTKKENEIFISFGDTNVKNPDYYLSRNADLEEAAANLFSLLHQADERNCNSIAISPIPMIGLGKAINDRIYRASKKE